LVLEYYVCYNFIWTDAFFSLLQKSFLENAFEKVKGKKADSTPHVKSQQQNALKMVTEAAAAGDVGKKISIYKLK
jgi:hypothetical protein